MRTFKLDPYGFKKVQKKVLIKTIPVALIAAIAGFYISSATQNTDISTVNPLQLSIPIILLALGFGLFNGLKRQKNNWDTFELTIDGETISRTQKNVPTVTINKKDIQKIFESPQGQILIKTGKRTDFISIPSSVREREELLNTLLYFGPINNQMGSNSKLTLIVSILSIGLLAAFFVSNEKSIIIPTGIILIAGLLWPFFEIQRSKVIDKRTKRGAYFIFLVLLSIVSRLLIELEIFSS